MKFELLLIINLFRDIFKYIISMFKIIIKVIFFYFLFINFELYPSFFFWKSLNFADTYWFSFMNKVEYYQKSNNIKYYMGASLIGKVLDFGSNECRFESFAPKYFNIKT